MDKREWHEHVKAAADRALRQVRADLNAIPPYDNDVPYWPDTIIVHEGLTCWGAPQKDLFDPIKRLGWQTEGRRTGPPERLSSRQHMRRSVTSFRPGRR